ATLFEAAGQAGIIMNTACGGRGICEKCEAILEPDGEKVLACQYRIERDLVVTIPVSSRFFEQKILAEGIETAGIQPDIYEKYLKIQPKEQILGVAVDIGTTTVVARLIDMQDGRCLATEAALNPQTRYGDDVVSRIAYADTDNKLGELQTKIIDCVNELITRLCKQANIDSNQIFEVCAVGNTTMNHIFLKLPVRQLGQAPYKAYSLDAKDTAADESGLQINSAGNIHTVENIAGFVGSDTTAVALATGIDAAEKMTLAVDIGTNGELVLGTAEKLYAASCAAGPALEGARISCGSRAVEGAIEAVVVNEDDIVLDVIGSSPAHSICGSGLIDAVAVLLNLGIVDATGRFVEAASLEDKLSPALLSRIIEKDKQPAFVLDDSQNVILTQADIRQVQLAKAAIRAGIILLEQKLGISDSDIERIFLAGAFGNYIRAESALRLKLLPDVPTERIRFVGNAASSGAQMILLSRHCREKAGQLARKIEYLEIAHQPEFEEVFANSMSF
ncbi:MAG: ASKHA domain-containing protein, partial [Phycisphaerae bacterium]|nr:ASKHA domain-containing protein [Phycisphaerae bacterium]